MNSIVTSREMKEIEKYTIQTMGIPSLVLMERAALSVVSHIKKRISKKDKICVVCGNGNNGADGVAISRILLEEGYQVRVVVLNISKVEYLIKKCSEEMRTQLHILDNLGVTWKTEIGQESFDVIVDAILGIGLTREIKDAHLLSAIESINSSGAYIYSVDIPSGIHTDTGKIMGSAIKASETITFAYKKVGLLLQPGKKYAGKVFCENIGIRKEYIKNHPAEHFSYDLFDGKNCYVRESDGNKGTFGKVLVIAGNDEISGACILNAGSVLNSGGGMVRIQSSEKTLDVVRKVLPEAMVEPLDTIQSMKEKIHKARAWADCVVIGSGIGTDEKAYWKMKYVLEEFPEEKRLVVDADGINLMARHPELRQMALEVKQLVYTPHMMELARLLGENIEQLKTNLDEIMKKVCSSSEAVYICKDSTTRVYQKDKPVFINTYGNSGMATAGSGDVLVGILGAILGKKGVDLFEGAIFGVHLHSLSGDVAAEKTGYHGLMASDIGTTVPEVLKMLEESLNV